MRTSEPIRFISDAVFQEASPPADRSRPLEWRRSFNTVNFELKRLNVDYVYSVNEVNHIIGLHPETTNESAAVTAAPQRRLRISAKVPQEDVRDSLFYTIETKKGSGLYELVRTKDDLHLTVVEAQPTEARGPFAAGAYAGLAFHANSEPGEDCLYIEVGIPSQQLEELIKLLNGDETLELHLSIGLQSFSYEVDDALREWYHPRDLFIHGGASPAALQTLRMVRPKAEDTPFADTEAVEVASEPKILPQKEPQSPALNPQLLLGVKRALWAIAVLVFLHLFK